MQVGDGGGGNRVAPAPAAATQGQPHVEKKGGWASLLDRVKDAVSSIQHRIQGKEQGVDRHLDHAEQRQREGSNFLNGKPRPAEVTPPEARTPPAPDGQVGHAVLLGLAPLHDGPVEGHDMKGPISKGGQTPTLPTPQAKGTLWT